MGGAGQGRVVADVVASNFGVQRKSADLARSLRWHKELPSRRSKALLREPSQQAAGVLRIGAGREPGVSSMKEAPLACEVARAGSGPCAVPRIGREDAGRIRLAHNMVFPTAVVARVRSRDHRAPRRDGSKTPEQALLRGKLPSCAAQARARARRP